MLTSDFIQTRDLRVHYLQQGSGDPVILIHGFPETSYEWRKQIPVLAEQYAVFAPDSRGFGETDKPGVRVSRQLLAQDVVAFMDSLGIESATVVGHDWGGIIAFKLAIDWPERVGRLALLDTLCTVWMPRGVHGYWFKAEPLPEEFFSRHHRGFIDTIFTGAADPPLPGRPESPWQQASGDAAPPRSWATADDVEHYRRAFADPQSHSHSISYYRYALPFHLVIQDPEAPRGERYESLSERHVADMWSHPDGIEKHPLFSEYLDYGPEDRHKRFMKPTLWMFGGRGTGPSSQIPRGNPFLEQFSRYFPDLRVRRIDAGHFFPEEAPEPTNQTLLGFLSGRF